jgi:hypothetical protein
VCWRRHRTEAREREPAGVALLSESRTEEPASITPWTEERISISQAHTVYFFDSFIPGNGRQRDMDGLLGVGTIGWDPPLHARTTCFPVQILNGKTSSI